MRHPTLTTRMIGEDVVVYLHPDGVHYLANFTEQGWRMWPAARDGWLFATACPATLADSCEELDSKHAALALRLSGVQR